MKCLLVTDTESLSKEISTLFEQAGLSDWEIYSCTELGDAMERCSLDSFDVHIISDGAFGIPLVKLLSFANENNCKGPFIIVRHGDGNSMSKRLRDLGAVDVLNLKNLTPSDFRRSVQQSIQFITYNEDARLRFSFEKLINKLATKFIDCPVPEIDKGIEQGLQNIGTFLGVDRACIFQFSGEEQCFEMIYEWYCPEISSAKSVYTPERQRTFNPLYSLLKEERTLYFSDLNELPPQHEDLQVFLKMRRVKSLAAIPMFKDQRLIGLLGFATLLDNYEWTPGLVSLLEIAAQIFSNALERKSREHTLLESETRFRSLVNNLQEGILLCDSSGLILHANDRFSLLAGHSKDSLTAKYLEELSPELEIVVPLLELHRQALRGKSNVKELSLSKPDGESRKIEVRTAPYFSSSGQLQGSIFTLVDISARYNALEALKHSEEKHREFVETSSDVIWAVDSEGRWTYVNPAVKQIYGYQPEEMLGRLFTEFVDPDHLAKDLETFAKILDGESYFQYETLHRRKDGTPVHLSFNAIVRRGDSGEVLGTTGTASDISSYKKAETALRESEERLRAYFEIPVVGITITSTNSGYIEVNEKFSEMLGYTQDELKELNFIDITHSEDIGESVARFSDLLERVRDTYTIDKRFIRKDGSILHCNVSVSRVPMDDGEQDYFIAVYQDISERKRAEDALRAIVEGTARATAENFFASVVEQLAGILDMKWAFVAELSPEEGDIAKVFASWLIDKKKYGEHYPIKGSPTESIIKSGGLKIFPSKISELFPEDTWLKSVGAECYLGKTLVDSTGKPIGILSVVDDKPMEHAETAKMLIDIFAARAGAEIERIRTERERTVLQEHLMQSQKMEAIGQLAAGVAHDLNNALSAIMGHLQLLELDNELGDQSKKSVSVAFKGCERAGSLIEQLLGFSRQGKYNLSPLSLQKSVNDTIEFLEKVVGSDFQLCHTRATKDLIIMADPGQLQQALTNLIINATHAMPGGGKISFDYESRHFKNPQRFNKSAAPGKYSVVTVTDTGVGISEENLKKIFEPFFTTKKEKKGSGLGLSMVYGILQNHGGWIDVESTLGSGTSFKLFFPEIDAVPLPEIISPGDNYEFTAGSIMVVDDEAFLVELTETFLKKNGFKTYGFTSPREAIRWYEENHQQVDLTILDMKMQEMDGTSCFDQLRAIDPEAQVVILSGFINESAAQNLLRRGAAQFFQKPLRYEELVAWVRKRVKGKNSEVPEQAA